MNVELITPYGFCFGVKKAISIAKKAKEENPNKDVFILGSLVHNERINDELKSLGLSILDESKLSIEEMIESLPNCSVIVFPAHGHSPSLDELAKKKDMVVYDATCAFVKSNEKMVVKALEDGNDVIYIGEKGHAEANGVLGINAEKIHLMTPSNPNGIDNIQGNKVVAISQTTMSPNDVDSCLEAIKSKYPACMYLKGRCHETKDRQEAIKNCRDEIDCYLLIGSFKSNNTNKLADLINKHHPMAKIIRALTVDDIKKDVDLLKNYKCIGIVSGASTSNDTVEFAFNFVKSL